MLHCDGRVLGVGDEVANRAGAPTKFSEDFQVIWARPDDPRSRPLGQ